jgi:zinc/manganese transport system substrate-binding protein
MARRPVASVLILPLLVIGACGTGVENDDSTVNVVATTSILGDIASAVVGDEGSVQEVIPLGVDSHEFQPSSQQASLLAGADLVVANGLGLEQSMGDLLASTADDGVPVLELAPLVQPIPLTGGHGHEEDEESEQDDEGAEDPHFWMDPIRVGEAAMALAAQLAELDPEGSWQQRAGAYADAMSAADASIRDMLARVPAVNRKLVTNHEAFGYFADRYDFEVVGVVIPGGSTLAEPSSAELSALVQVMRDEGVSVIFAETTQPTTLADAVASELGEEVKVVELYTESLGPTGSTAATLEGLLLTNAERVAAALE